MARHAAPAGLLMLLLLSACGGASKLAPVEERGASDQPVSTGRPDTVTSTPAVTRPLPAAGSESAGSPETAPPGAGTGAHPNPAVVALLNDANRAAGAGHHDQAAANVERALAIEPQSAWLWHRLAAIRLAQGELGQAAALAAKSNSLAAEDRRLQADNWRLIAEVHRRRGEHTAAESAAGKAARLAPP